MDHTDNTSPQTSNDTSNETCGNTEEKCGIDYTGSYSIPHKPCDKTNDMFGNFSKILENMTKSATEAIGTFQDLLTKISAELTEEELLECQRIFSTYPTESGDFFKEIAEGDPEVAKVWLIQRECDPALAQKIVDYTLQTTKVFSKDSGIINIIDSIYSLIGGNTSDNSDTTNFSEPNIEIGEIGKKAVETMNCADFKVWFDRVSPSVEDPVEDQVEMYINSVKDNARKSDLPEEEVSKLSKFLSSIQTNIGPLLNKAENPSDSSSSTPLCMDNITTQLLNMLKTKDEPTVNCKRSKCDPSHVESTKEEYICRPIPQGSPLDVQNKFDCVMDRLDYVVGRLDFMLEKIDNLSTRIDDMGLDIELIRSNLPHETKSYLK